MILDQPNIELDELKHIHTPCLVVGAQNDMIKAEIFVKINDALPNSALIIYPNHDHLSYVVHTDVIYQDLCDFFKVKA
jgi:pimeloyl-ACP methyl ester carboxylesterase